MGIGYTIKITAWLWLRRYLQGWNCTKASSIWSRSLRIVATRGVNGNVVLGSIQGLSLKRESWGEPLNPQGHGFTVQGGQVFQCDGVRHGTNFEFFEEIWLMVACLSVWHIWIMCCKYVF